MKRKYINKLVRDKVPQLVKKNGQIAKIRVLAPKEFEKELKKKLLEEAQEVVNASRKEIIDELADVLEVVEELANYYQLSFSEIKKHQRKKRDERGRFSQKIFLISVSEAQ